MSTADAPQAVPKLPSGFVPFTLPEAPPLPPGFTEDDTGLPQPTAPRGFFSSLLDNALDVLSPEHASLSAQAQHPNTASVVNPQLSLAGEVPLPTVTASGAPVSPTYASDAAELRRRLNLLALAPTKGVDDFLSPQRVAQSLIGSFDALHGTGAAQRALASGIEPYTVRGGPEYSAGDNLVGRGIRQGVNNFMGFAREALGQKFEQTGNTLKAMDVDLPMLRKIGESIIATEDRNRDAAQGLEPPVDAGAFARAVQPLSALGAIVALSALSRQPEAVPALEATLPEMIGTALRGNAMRQAAAAGSLIAANEIGGQVAAGGHPDVNAFAPKALDYTAAGLAPAGLEKSVLRPALAVAMGRPVALGLGKTAGILERVLTSAGLSTGVMGGVNALNGQPFLAGAPTSAALGAGFGLLPVHVPTFAEENLARGRQTSRGYRADLSKAPATSLAATEQAELDALLTKAQGPESNAEVAPNATPAQEPKATRVIKPGETVTVGQQPPVPDKPLYDMTHDELLAFQAQARAFDNELDARILGDRLAEYKAAQREAASRDRATAARGMDAVDAIEDTLTREERDALYGIGMPKMYSQDELRDYINATAQADARTPQEATYRTARYLEALGRTTGTDPSGWSDAERVAYAGLREVRANIRARGWDERAISSTALRVAAQRFSDPVDAEFMLQRFLDLPKGAAPRTPALAAPEPTASGTEGGAPEATVAAPEPAPAATPGVAPAADKSAERTALEASYYSRLPAEIGWSERGGHIVRAPDTGGEKPVVVGRTHWIPQAGPNGDLSILWQTRPEKGGRITEAGAREAFRKEAAGETLNAKEQRFIDHAHDIASRYADDFERENAEFERERSAMDDAEQQRAADDLRKSDAEFFAPQTPEAIMLAQWTERAYSAGVPAEDIIGATLAPDTQTQIEEMSRLATQQEAANAERPATEPETAPEHNAGGPEPSAEGTPADRGAEAPTDAELERRTAEPDAATAASADAGVTRADTAEAPARPHEAPTETAADAERAQSSEAEIGPAATAEDAYRARSAQRANELRATDSVERAREIIREHNADTKAVVKGAKDRGATDDEMSAIRNAHDDFVSAVHEKSGDPAMRTTRKAERAEPEREIDDSGSEPERRARNVQRGEAEARASGAAALVERELGPARMERVHFIHDGDGVPPNVRRGLKAIAVGNVRYGLHASNGDIYILTKNARDPATALWVAWHEGGHEAFARIVEAHPDVRVNGLPVTLARQRARDVLLQNHTLAALADIIGHRRHSTDRGAMAEEALVELYAARHTDGWHAIKAKYGMTVPESLRVGIGRAIDRFVARMKAILNAVYARMSGDNSAPFTDAQVVSLMDTMDVIGAANREQSGGLIDAARNADVAEPRITTEEEARAAEPEPDTPLEEMTEPVERDNGRDFTDTERAALRIAGLGKQVDRVSSVANARSAIRGALGAAQDALRGSGGRFMQSVVDSYYGLGRAVSAVGGIPDRLNAYMAATLAQTASTMEAVLRFGAPELYQGGIRVLRDPNVMGLLDALDPVHNDLTAWLGWVVGRRAKLLMGQGREHAFTEDQIDTLLHLRDGHEEAFDRAALNYLRLKTAVLDFAQKAGVIDPAGRKLWDHLEYIPFYRDLERFSGTPRTKRSLGNQVNPIKHLKGGEQALRNPLQNIIANFTVLIDSATHNHAALLAVDTLGKRYFTKAKYEMEGVMVPLDQVKDHLTKVGVDDFAMSQLPPDALKGLAKMYAIKPPMGDDIVSVMRDGRREYYHVADPLLYRSLTAMAGYRTPAALKPLIWVKQILVAGATSSPDFMIRNILRDTLEAGVTAQGRFFPLYDTLRGVASDLVEDKLTQDLIMSGASFRDGYFRTGDMEDTAKTIARTLRAHGKSPDVIADVTKTLMNPKRMWDIYRRIAESTEMGTRIALARHRIAEGSSYVGAMFEAKDLLNFQRRGDNAFIRGIMQTIPFLNARVQGADRLIRVGITQKGRRGSVAARLAIMASMSGALYWWNQTHYKDAYDELPGWDKDAYWHIAPGTAYHVRIPIPFELGLVGKTMIDRGWGAMNHILFGSGDYPDQTAGAFWRAVTNTLAIQMPQIALPIAESLANKDFYFNYQIENDEDRFRSPKNRFNAHTSPTMRIVSDALSKIPLIGSHYPSPKSLEHYWRGYTAMIGIYALDAADFIVRKAEGAPSTPALHARDFPFIHAVYEGDAPLRSTQYTTEYYKMRKDAQTARNDINAALSMGDEASAIAIAKKNSWLLGDAVASKGAKYGFVFDRLNALNKVRDAFATIRHQQDAIYTSTTLSPVQKRDQIDALTKARNDIAEKVARYMRAKQAGQ